MRRSGSYLLTHLQISITSYTDVVLIQTVSSLFFSQVGSRMVIVVSGVLMVVMGVLGKVAAIFTTIPSPVMGGMFIVMFGVIAAAGVSNLQVYI